jgi:superfamily II DNA or RNA helicase
LSADTSLADSHNLGGILVDAKYIPAVEQVLGVTLLPHEVESALAESSRPAGLSWEGEPVWATAYMTGMHVLAAALGAERDTARTQPGYSAAGFRQTWSERYLSPDSDGLTEIIETRVFQDGDSGRQMKQRVARAARNVLMANTMAATQALPSENWADRDGPRATLQNYFGNVLHWFTQSPPKQSELTPAKKPELLPNSLVLVAPTGVGKTMVGGNYLASVGIGKTGLNGQRRRALWVTTSQQQVADCLNPNKTLRRCLDDDVAITAIWEGSKTEEAASGDVQGVTVQSLEEALVEGLIKPADIDTMVFDEAHHALSPRLTKLLEQFDCPKVLMTATPTRSELRSLLNNYHYVRPMSRREAVESELLSPVRSLTFQAASDAQAEHIAARSAAELFISKGKKAVIYCQAGDNNAQARRVAALADAYAKEIMGDAYDESPSYAEMVGSARNDSPESIRQFEEQTHGGIRTTCQMLGEGWDYAELDGGIWVGTQTDLLALEQESGRALRPKADGREAILIEIPTVIGEDAGDQRRYCLAQTFGLEDIPGANVVFGQERNTGTDGPSGGGHGTGGSSGGGSGTGGPSGTGSRDFEQELSEELRQHLVGPGTPIVEIIIEPSSRGRYIPPEGFTITDTELAERYRVPLSYVHYHFESRNGHGAIPYKLIRRVPTGFQEIGEERIYQRYYNTAELEACLLAHPMPAVSGEQIYSRSTIANMLHVATTIVDEAIAQLELPDREPTRPPVDAGVRGAKQAVRYSTEELSLIGEWVEQVPVADATDTPLVDVLALFPFAGKILTAEDRVVKRHPPEVNRRGRDYFVSQEALEHVLLEYERRSGSLVALGEIAVRAGVRVSVVKRALTDGEAGFAAANRFTPPGGTRHAPHVSEAMATAIVERIRPRGLEPFEVTRDIIFAHVNASSAQTLYQYLQKLSPSPANRTLPASPYPVNIYNIAILRYAEQQFGRRNNETGTEAIIHDNLPSSAASSAEQLAYGRHVQTAILGIAADRLAPFEPTAAADGQASTPAAPRLVSRPRLRSLEESPSASRDSLDNLPVWADAEVAMSTLNCTAAALPVLLAMSSAAPEEVERNGDGRVVRIRDAAIRRMHAKEFPMVAVGWVSRTKLLEVAAQRGKTLPAIPPSQGQQGLFRPRPNDKLDVYYSLNLARWALNNIRNQ